jgi:hypothetical protein
MLLAVSTSSPRLPLSDSSCRLAATTPHPQYVEPRRRRLLEYFLQNQMERRLDLSCRKPFDQQKEARCRVQVCFSIWTPRRFGVGRSAIPRRSDRIKWRLAKAWLSWAKGGGVAGLPWLPFLLPGVEECPPFSQQSLFSLVLLIPTDSHRWLPLTIASGTTLGVPPFSDTHDEGPMRLTILISPKMRPYPIPPVSIG